VSPSTAESHEEMGKVANGYLPHFVLFGLKVVDCHKIRKLKNELLAERVAVRQQGTQGAVHL
jgi:hypothetical protein